MVNHPDALKKVKFDSLIEGLEYAAQTDKGWRFYDIDGALLHKASYAQAKELAVILAKKIASFGWPRSSRIGLLAHQDPSFLIAFFACQYAGLLPCPLPPGTQVGGEEAYVSHLASLMQNAKLTALIGPEIFREIMLKAETLSITGCPNILSYEELNELSPKGDLAPFGKDDLAYIQYSSGSTAIPKGVVVSQHAVTSNIALTLRDGLNARATDRTVSWLPFSHTMGLGGHVLASICGISTVDYLSPQILARKPSTWIKLLSEKKAQTSFAPSFAWGLAANIPDPGQYDLSHMRIAGIGGDTIQLTELDAFYSAFRDSGFKRNCFLPCYGMTETVLAITFHTHGKDLVTHSLHPKGRPIVSVGKVLPGIDLIIVDDDGKELPEKHIGYIWVRAPDLMTSYFDDKETTEASFRRDGFRDTGDMGYRIDGELIITGRSKEMILYRGRNIWPQDIEQIIEKKFSVHALAAFSVNEEASEKVVVLIETSEPDKERQSQLVQNASASLRTGLGVSSEIVLITPGSLPYTSSGKLARAEARDYYIKNLQEKYEKE